MLEKMIKHSSGRIDNKENDTKGVMFLYQLHMPPSTKVNLALVANKKIGEIVIV